MRSKGLRERMTSIGMVACMMLCALWVGCDSSKESSGLALKEEPVHGGDVSEEVEADVRAPEPVIGTPMLALPSIQSPLIFVAGQRAALPVSSVGFETVRVRCYEIRLEDHPVASLLSPVDDGLEEVCDKRVKTQATDHASTRTIVDLDDVFGEEGRHLLLRVEAEDLLFGDHPKLPPREQWSSAPIYRTALRSGLSIDYARDSRTDEVTIRVSREDDGAPVEGARVFEIGSTKEVFTDVEGLARPPAISAGERKKLIASWPLRRRRFREAQPPSAMDAEVLAREWRWFVAATEDDEVLVGGPVLRIADNRLRSWVPKPPSDGDVAGDVDDERPAFMLPTESEPLRGEVSTVWFDEGAPGPGDKVRMHIETSPTQGYGLVFIHTRQGTTAHSVLLEGGRGELQLDINRAYSPLTDVHVLAGEDHLSLEWYFPPISKAHLSHLPSRSKRALPWPVELQIHRSRDHLVNGEGVVDQ